MSSVESDTNEPATPGLSSEEYSRRKEFLDNLKSLSKAEYIEIVRILRNHSVTYSENQNGIFFNVASLQKHVFDSLEKFLHFTQMNRKNLAERDKLISTLMTATHSQCVVEQSNEADTV